MIAVYFWAVILLIAITAVSASVLVVVQMLNSDWDGSDDETGQE